MSEPTSAMGGKQTLWALASAPDNPRDANHDGQTVETDHDSHPHQKPAPVVDEQAEKRDTSEIEEQCADEARESGD